MSQLLKTENKRLTFDEYYLLVPDGQKADLLDGVMYMASPESLESNDLVGFLDFLIAGFNSAKRLGGHVMVSRFAFKLSTYYSPEPDVAYVRPERLHLLNKKWMDGAPDVAVEIVSEDSKKRDYRDKRACYEETGASEYWIIDPLKCRTEFLRLKEGRYESVALEAEHIFRSAVISGFWLDTSWLFQEPLPEQLDCLLEILK